jgi:hypothetical protein
MRTDWSLLWLKDLHGENASRYPASAAHTAAARARKALRLVGLRTDLIVRKVDATKLSSDEYAFADFGPAGGEFALMASGPPFRVLGMAPLPPTDATALGGAADPDPANQRLRTLDVVLDRLVRAALQVAG